MPGVWTDPRTWVDGETPTGAQFNTQIRDNLKFLKSNPTFDGDTVVNGGVNATGDVAVGDDLTVVGDALINGTTTINDALTVKGSVGLGDASSDIVDVKGTVVGAPLKTYTETRTNPAIAGGAVALDCALGTYFTIALNANVTVSILNPPAAGRALGITIIFTADGTLRTVTWPAAVKWVSGIVPTMTTAAGKKDIVTLVTEDGGVNWFGVVVGQNY